MTAARAEAARPSKTSSFRLRVIAWALLAELPFVVVTPPAIHSIASDGRWTLLDVGAALGAQLGKTLLVAIVLFVSLGRVQRDLERAATASIEGLDAAARRVRALPRRIGALWAVLWGATLASHTAAFLLLGETRPLGAREVVACGLAGVAGFAASLAYATTLMMLLLRPAAVQLAELRVRAGTAPDPRAVPLQAVLLLVSLCMAVAPTTWMGCLAVLARADAGAVAAFSFTAFLWAPICAAFLASVLSDPVRRMQRVFEEVAEHGEITHASRALALGVREHEALAGGVNQMIDRLREASAAVRAALDEAEARVRETSEALRARDEFLSVAGHELRTPLTTMELQLHGVSRAAARGDDAALRRYAAQAEKSGRRLGRLVDELLDVARIQTGRFSLERERMDLAELARDLVERNADAAGQAGSALRLTRAEEPIVGQWDRSRLEQVLQNLISNALRYARGQPVDVVVERVGDEARLSVRDRGPGVPAEDQRRIFEKFERAEAERAAGGLGLGLWIAHEIVAAHGGTIRVDSAPGEGASFVVALPIPLEAA